MLDLPLALRLLMAECFENLRLGSREFEKGCLRRKRGRPLLEERLIDAMAEFNLSGRGRWLNKWRSTKRRTADQHAANSPKADIERAHAATDRRGASSPAISSQAAASDRRGQPDMPLSRRSLEVQLSPPRAHEAGQSRRLARGIARMLKMPVASRRLGGLRSFLGFERVLMIFAMFSDWHYCG
jgi:hypothetical protein